MPQPVTLHRFVIGCVPGDGKIVDHINGDGLDNRRENLRFVTKSQNAQNQRARSREASSVFRGVQRREDNKWQVNVLLPEEQLAAELAAALRAVFYPYSPEAEYFHGNNPPNGWSELAEMLTEWAVGWELVRETEVEPLPLKPKLRRDWTVCINGHPMTPDNLESRSDSSGKRCKACRNEQRARRAARKAAAL